MKKWILALYMLIKSILPCEKPTQKRVLEKVKVTKKFRKKNAPKGKKSKGK